MDKLDFSEEEIEEQLVILGYKNIPKHRLHMLKQDLDDLIRQTDWKEVDMPPRVNSMNANKTLCHPHPPAYTKEKVGHCYVGRSGEGFFLHRGGDDHDSQVLANTRHNNRWKSPERWDSYAQHTLAPTRQLPSDGPGRLQVELDPKHADSLAPPPDAQGRRFMKRKVLRKHQGRSLVCDESGYSEDSDVASCLEERLEELHVSTLAQSESEKEVVTSHSDTHSSDTEGSSLDSLESHVETRCQSAGSLRPKSKAFIRPLRSLATTKKTDPVAKYFQYKQLWDLFKAPGEREHRALRLEIKERLAYHPPPTRPQRAYVPNTYIVPTDKKRSALCWEIRSALANRLVPHKFSCPF